MSGASDLNPALDVSVVVCTRNRAEPLRRLLTSMAEMQTPPGLNWELVVVDNGSTDRTREVAASFSDRLPIVYTAEQKAGLSNARNHGVSVARGRYLCWTDDDVTVDRDWLSAYVAAFREHPEAAIFGGRIVPVLEGPTPKWFARYSSRWPLTGLVASREFGDEPRPIDFRRDVIPWGANFAIRAEEQRQHRYDVGLGVSPLQRRSGEECQLMYEIAQQGASGWMIPESKVHHHYPPHRQSFRYLFDHYRAIGETQAYLDETRPHHVMNQDGRGPRVFGVNPSGPWLIYLINFVAYSFFRAIGLTLRSTYHLRRSGLYKGIYAYNVASRSRGP